LTAPYAPARRPIVYGLPLVDLKTIGPYGQPIASRDRFGTVRYGSSLASVLVPVTNNIILASDIAISGGRIWQHLFSRSNNVRAVPYVWLACAYTHDEVGSSAFRPSLLQR
jgi:hypothetical protein